MRPAAITLAAVLSVAASTAQADTRYSAAVSHQCQKHFAEAEETYGLPKGLLRAVSLTESGVPLDDGTTGPWPWSINVSAGQYGKDYRFDTREEAVAFAKSVKQRSIDLGCLQLNRRWDSYPIESDDSRIDPHNNVFWTAYLLATFHKNSGSWGVAVAEYHAGERAPGARTPEWEASALDYAQKVARNLASR